jgi:hypothetical protein
MTTLARIAVVALVAAFCATPALATKHSTDPETDKALGPQDGAGHYFPGQSSTAEFHGCRKSDVQWFPTSLISGNPTTAPSTHKYVTFTVNTDSLPTFSWKAKDGYTICGVEAFAGLESSQIKTSELLSWISYKSGEDSGSTAVSGRETIKVHMPKSLGTGDPQFEVFAGKTLGIDGFQAITVYVKKG